MNLYINDQKNIDKKKLTIKELFSLLIERLQEQDKEFQIKAQVLIKQKNYFELEKDLQLAKNLTEITNNLNDIYFRWNALELVENGSKPNIVQRTVYEFDNEKEKIIIRTKDEQLKEDHYINYLKYGDFLDIIVRLIFHMRNYDAVKTADLMEKNNDRAKVDRCFRVLMKESLLIRDLENHTYYHYTSPNTEEKILEWISKHDEILFLELNSRI